MNLFRKKQQPFCPLELNLQKIAAILSITPKNPIIDRAHHYNAFNNTYYVTVTTPEGCVYSDDVTVKNAPQSDILPIQEWQPADECTSPNGTVITLVTVKLTNVTGINEISFVDQTTGEIFILEYDEAQSDDYHYYFNVHIPRDIDRDLVLDLSNYPEFGAYPACYAATDYDCNINTELFIPEIATTGATAVHLSNVFSPDGDGFNDYFYHSSALIIDNDPSNDDNCDISIDPTKSSLTYYNLRIFDRWGELVFEGEIEADENSTTGVDISQVKWDGYFNGQKASTGVYTWTAEFHTCYLGIDYDIACQIDPWWETYVEGEVYTLSGDLTLL